MTLSFSIKRCPRITGNRIFANGSLSDLVMHPKENGTAGRPLPQGGGYFPGEAVYGGQHLVFGDSAAYVYLGDYAR